MITDDQIVNRKIPVESIYAGTPSQDQMTTPNTNKIINSTKNAQLEMYEEESDLPSDSDDFKTSERSDLMSL